MVSCGGACVVLTAVGYVLIFLSGLAIGLFCWLSYSSLSGAARPTKAPAEDSFLEQAARDITPRVSAQGH
jgi:hypothetical protein